MPWWGWYVVVTAVVVYGVFAGKSNFSHSKDQFALRNLGDKRTLFGLFRHIYCGFTDVSNSKTTIYVPEQSKQ